MKTGRSFLAVVALLLLTLGPGHTAELFHAGWTGRCEGCHGPASGVNSSTGVTTSEVCLRCHAAASPADYQVATHPTPPPGIPPQSLTPGGDFSYLRKDYTWSESNGEQASSPGERHGHNIIAPSYGYYKDSTHSVSPGGTYSSDMLSCVSCHDPHGNYRLIDEAGTIVHSGNPIIHSGSYGATPTASEAIGTYRLLAGKGYSRKYSDHLFQYDPPIAIAPQHYNRPETNVDTRVAYGKGTSEWCANCHGELAARVATGDHAHVAGIELGEEVARTYNRYVKTGDFNGSVANSYSSLVAFQSGDVTSIPHLAQLTKSNAGPGSTDKITCLTCHRAHASAWNAATRWNTKADFITVAAAYPGIDTADQLAGGRNAGGKTVAEYRKAMYGRDVSRFASYQRSLCNKCHAKD